MKPPEPEASEAECSVIKIGGARVQVEADLDELCVHVRRLVDAGRRVIVVHGGGAEIASLHDMLGIPRQMRDGLRVTPDHSMDLVTMVLAGLVNKRLVAALGGHKVRAIGLSGLDLGLLQADFLDQEKLGRVGADPRVDPAPLRVLLGQGWMPVIAPVSVGPDGKPINVNADTAAQAIAGALGAHTLDFVSDVAGVRSGDKILKRLCPADVEHLIRAAVVRGGMIPKLRAATAALNAGVGRVRVGDLHTMRQDACTVVCR